MKLRAIRDYLWKINHHDLDSKAVWQETQRMISSFYASKILSVLYYQQQENAFICLFSSETRVHAVGVKMRYRQNEWSRRALHKGDTIVFTDKMMILEQFDKGALLISLGYQATLTVPVRHQNRVVGVVNFINEQDIFDSALLADVQLIVKMLIPYILDAGMKSARTGLWGVLDERV